jgi:hypothetical protein
MSKSKTKREYIIKIYQAVNIWIDYRVVNSKKISSAPADSKRSLEYRRKGIGIQPHLFSETKQNQTNF